MQAPCSGEFVRFGVEHDALMTLNLSGKLEDLVVVCV